MLFGKKRREKEEREAKALEKIMTHIIQAEEKKEEKAFDLEETIKTQYKDFPMEKLLLLLVKKNILQLKDLEEKPEA